jgi:hypothetical protein
MGVTTCSGGFLKCSPSGRTRQPGCWRSGERAVVGVARIVLRLPGQPRARRVGGFGGLFRLSLHERRARFEHAETVLVANQQTEEEVSRAFCEARDGRLWVGTDTGLLHVSPEGSTNRYGAKDGLPGDDVRSLHRDACVEQGLFFLRHQGPHQGQQKQSIEQLTQSSLTSQIPSPHPGTGTCGAQETCDS